MGTVFVHDGRPDRPGHRTERWVDEQGYGPLVQRHRTRRRLTVGEMVTLPDGSTWPVVSFRETVTALGWRQHVLAGEHRPPVRPLTEPLVDTLSASWLRAG